MGLSKARFQSISSLSQPFFCPRCLLVHQFEELSNLLSAEVSELKAQVLSLSTENSPRPESATVPVKSSSEVPFTSVTQRQLARTKRLQSATNSATGHEPDRRFNIVEFGVPEMPSGFTRYVRRRHDFKEVSSLISDLEQGSDHNSSIRDCRRLGKFESGKSQHHPILVSLNSTADVYCILSRCHSFTTLPQLSTLENTTQTMPAVSNTPLSSPPQGSN